MPLLITVTPVVADLSPRQLHCLRPVPPGAPSDPIMSMLYDRPSSSQARLAFSSVVSS